MSYCSCSRSEKQVIANIYLDVLKTRFENKINYNEYYLSYSGGKDSHLLYWFIKDYLKIDEIPIIAVNTRMEHIEIRERMYKYADKVMISDMTPTQVKELYGIPCFTKGQDEYIKRYQNGNRTEHTMSRILGTKKSMHNLNMKARSVALNPQSHMISNKCCIETKEKTLKRYEKESGRKSILGVRGAESINRRQAYHTCLTKKGVFTPIFDFTDMIVDAIYDIYDIEVPELYNVAARSGCIGCPYINNKKRIILDLKLATPKQRKYAIELFKESYDVKGIDYQQFL